MARKQVKITTGIVVIVAAIAYFAFAGFEEGKAYYKTIDELEAMGDAAQGKRLRVAGIVKEGSIQRDGREVHFELEAENLTLAVHYRGSQPVPDTFKDGAEALVEGHRASDGTFEADHIQAKCASKYEAKVGEEHPEGVPKSY
jgi:cytochrome c-type biogenesis protein CcmE